MSTCFVLSPGEMQREVQVSGWLQGGSWPYPSLSCVPWQATSLSFMGFIFKEGGVKKLEKLVFVLPVTYQTQ